MNIIGKVLASADGRWDIDDQNLSIAFATGMAIAGAASSLTGSNRAAKALEKQAELAKERGREQQTYNQVAATEVMAIGRMNAAEDRRQARLIASRAVAVGAAGGAVEDIEHLIADIYGEGAYRAAISLMDGQSQSNRLLFEGDQAAKYGTDQASSLRGTAKAQRLSGYGSLIQTGSKLFGGFNFGGTTPNTSYTRGGL